MTINLRTPHVEQVWNHPLSRSFPMMVKKSFAVLVATLATAFSVQAQGVLPAESTIAKNAVLLTRSGHYALIMQHDGNAVIYYIHPAGNVPTGWQTNTSNGDHLTMHMDGNLALHKSNNAWSWTSGTGGRPYDMGYKLVLSETGSLQILDANNALVIALADHDSHAKSGGGHPLQYPFRKLGPGSCVDSLTDLVPDGKQAIAWANAHGGTIGYCGSPY